MAAWGAAALVLLSPLVAMQFTEEVAWDLADFAVFGAMLAGAGLTFELAVRTVSNKAYRAAVGVALAAAFLLVWVNAAVGIIGTEDNPANSVFGGVLAVGIIGSAIARLQPLGMMRALFATAVLQASVAVIAAIAGIGHPDSPPLEILGVNALFTMLWLISAWLFRKAAREHPPAGRSAGS